ncbi:hypothetical protein B0H14DRAFT_3428045 [Mycena olivaceomarginata]|nr:hypothetical protein B0H14DRAFT_3428045 [Mycena olivaceomarginata]
MPWEVHQVVNVVSSLHGYILFPPPFSFVVPVALFYAKVSIPRFGACPVRTSVPPRFGTRPVRTSASVPSALRCPPRLGARPIRTSVPVPSALRCPSRLHFGARPALRCPSARRRLSRPHFGFPRASVLVPSALRAPPRFGTRAVRTSLLVLHFSALLVPSALRGPPRFGARSVRTSVPVRASAIVPSALWCPPRFCARPIRISVPVPSALRCPSCTSVPVRASALVPCFGAHRSFWPTAHRFSTLRCKISRFLRLEGMLDPVRESPSRPTAGTDELTGLLSTSASGAGTEYLVQQQYGVQQQWTLIGNFIGPNGEQLMSTDPYNTTVFVGDH